VENLVHNPFGSPKGLDTGSGGSVSNKSGDCNCLEGINPGTMMEQNFSYDDNGNLFSISAPNTPWLDQRLDYDAQNRLVSAVGAYGTIGYTYDMVGNSLSRTINAQTDTYSYQPGTNRLAAISGTKPATFSYDANGKITEIDTKTLIYNQNNRLIRVEEEVDILAEYRYNGLSQRIIKEVAGATTIYHYDFDDNIIAESSVDGTFNFEYLYMGGSRLAQVDVGTGALNYYLNNYLGTPLLMTDAAGKVVWEANYKPFGEATVNPNSSVVNNFRFAGQYYDSETGLHYNYHRYYNPKTGRYLTPDPIGLAGGINLFVYSENNPINLVDPWGLRAGSAVRPGTRGLDPSAHPVFQPGTYENQLIANDLNRVTWIIVPQPLARDAGHLHFGGGFGELWYDALHPNRPDPYDIEKSKRKYKESRQPIDLKYGGQCKEEGPPPDICDKLDEVMRDRTKPRWKRWAAGVAYWKNGCFNR